MKLSLIFPKSNIFVRRKLSQRFQISLFPAFWPFGSGMALAKTLTQIRTTIQTRSSHVEKLPEDIF
ncbi:hypothetical protein B0E43_03680 [Algoriphagus sp. A40]|nr:hypothetical protein B0E43_03680 [Algoriphagus sp. A40]